MLKFAHLRLQSAVHHIRPNTYRINPFPARPQHRHFAMTVPQHTSLHKIEINVDCGEGFGNWEGGPDEELMPMIDVANVACGGHAGSPTIIGRTVEMARKHGVKVGAREWNEWQSVRKTYTTCADPGFPDKAGFGRRFIQMTSEEAYSEVYVRQTLHHARKLTSI